MYRFTTIWNVLSAVSRGEIISMTHHELHTVGTPSSNMVFKYITLLHSNGFQSKQRLHTSECFRLVIPQYYHLHRLAGNSTLMSSTILIALFIHSIGYLFLSLCFLPTFCSLGGCRSASPAWLSVTEAFGCDEEMAKRLIEFGAFYRQKRADKPRRITDPSATGEQEESLKEAEIIRLRDTLALSTENKRTSCGVDSTILAASFATVARIFPRDKEDLMVSNSPRSR